MMDQQNSKKIVAGLSQVRDPARSTLRYVSQIERRIGCLSCSLGLSEPKTGLIKDVNYIPTYSVFNKCEEILVRLKTQVRSFRRPSKSDIQVIGCVYLIFVCLFVSFFSIRCRLVLEPSSGSEKDVRRELYKKKKNNKKDRFEEKVHKVAPRLDGRKLEIPKSMTLEELENIMRVVPKTITLDPKSTIMDSFKDRMYKWLLTLDSNKVAVNAIAALFESISLLILNLYQAHTKKHQLCLLLMWVQNRFASNKSLLLNMTEMVCWFAKFDPKDLSETLTSLTSLWSGDISISGFLSLFKGDKEKEPLELHPRAERVNQERVTPRIGPETVGAPLDNPEKGFKAYTESETIRRLKALIQMFVDAGMCTVFGYNFDFSGSVKVLDWVNTATHRFEMVEFASSTIMYFIERGYAAYDARNIKYLFFSNDFIHAELEYRELENEVKLLYAGETDGDANMVARLEAKVTKLRDVYKKDLCRAKMSHQYTLSDRIGKLNQMLLDISILQKKVGQRKAPFAILFYGLSGVGKSWCTGTIIPSLLNSIGLPTDPYHIRSINQTDDYDTMIDNSTLAIQVDDICNGNPTFEKKNPVDCILRFMNNMMCPANKADLKDKGRVFFSPAVVVTTTNVKMINAYEYSMEPISILRRFDEHITVQCDPKYMTDQKLDRTKWPQYNQEVGLPPLTFTVERVTGITPTSLRANGTHNKMGVRYDIVTWERDENVKILMDNVDWTVLEPYLSSRIRSKAAIQGQYLTDLKRTANPLRCKCDLSFPFCKKHYDHAISCRVPACMMLLKRRKMMEKVVTWVGGITAKNTRFNKNRKIEKVYWRKKFRFGNLTSDAFNAILGLKGVFSPEVVFRGDRYFWIDGSKGNKNRSFKILPPIIPMPPLPNPIAHLQPRSARILQVDTAWDLIPSDAPELRRGGPIVLFFSDDDDSDSDWSADSDGPLHQIDTTQFTFHNMGLVLRGDDLVTDDDDAMSEADSTFSETYESDSDDDLNIELFNHQEEDIQRGAGDELRPRAGNPREDRILAYWAIMLDWWNYIGGIEFRTCVDLKKLEIAHDARMNLVMFGCAEYIPFHMSSSPPYIPSTEIEGFFLPRRTNSDDLVSMVLSYNAYFKSIQVCQSGLNTASEVIENKPSDDVLEQHTTYDRICTALRFVDYPIVQLPFRFGFWVTCRMGSSSGGALATLCGNIVACLFTVSMCFSIPGLFLSGFCMLFGCVFWGTSAVAMCIGAKYTYMLRHIRNFKSAATNIAAVARNTLRYKYHIIFGSVAVLACGALCYKYRKRKDKELSPSGNTIAVPVPRTNERTNNYWSVNKVSLTDSVGISGYQNTPDEMLSTILPGLVRIRIYAPGIKSVSEARGGECEGCCALIMAGNLLVVPHHIVSGKMGRLIHAMRSEPGKVRNNAEWILNEKEYYRIPNTDFGVIYTTSLGPAKDFRRFLPKVISRDQCRVKWILKEKSDLGPFPTLKGFAVVGYDSATVVTGVGNYDGYNFQLLNEFGEKYTSKSGWCMSPLVSATNPSFIHSFYLAGKGEIHRSAPFLESYVDKAIDYFKNNNKALVPSSGVFKAGDESLDSFGKRSPLYHMDKCVEEEISFDYCGTREGSARRFSGSVRDTPFEPYMKEVFDSSYKWKSPKFLGSWKPWWDNLMSMSVKMKPMDPYLLDIAQDDLRSSLLGFCSSWRGHGGETFQDVVHPVDMEVAINGVPGVSGCDRIKMNTSAGFPHNCKKSKVISEVPDDKYPCGTRLEPNTEIKDGVEYIIDCAKNDVRSNIVFTASVKDEPTVIEKDKVRVFAGCPVSYLIAIRMWTCMLVKFMTDNHLAFFTVAGANAHDYDWTLIAQFLASYSITRIIAGDYSNYDKKILAMLMVRAVELTCDMLRLAGYSEENVNIAKNMMMESCYPIYEWNGDFIHVCGSNPSGQPLTVWLNNLVNLMYQRYCFYSFYDKEHKFDDCVRILVMGDDNIMSVKEGFDMYNHTSIQKIFKDLGMNYTMADKSTESVPYITLGEASLLKRGFVWSDVLDCWMAPVEEKSILRCLSSHMLSSGSTSEAINEHCEMMADTALAEWFYYGEDVYNDRKSKVEELLKRVKLFEHVPLLKSYDEQLVNFKARVLSSRCLFGIEPKMKWVKEFVIPEVISDVLVLDPKGGFMGYDLKPEFGFREVFVGKKHEVHAEFWYVCGSTRRTLVIVDCFVATDLRDVPNLFEPECWINTFCYTHLGIHHASYFEDDDPRVLYRRGDWVLLLQDDLLNSIYIGSLREGVVTVDGDPIGCPTEKNVGNEDGWLDRFNTQKR